MFGSFFMDEVLWNPNIGLWYVGYLDYIMALGLEVTITDHYLLGYCTLVLSSYLF